MRQELYRSLILRAKETPRTIAIPEALNEKMLKTAIRAKTEGFAEPVLIGDPDEIRTNADSLGLDISGLEISDLNDEARNEELVQRYRKINTMFGEKSLRKKVKNPLNHAAVMVALGDVDTLFAGIEYSTGDVIFAGQAFIGTQEGIQTVSSVGIMEIPGFEGSEGELLAFADCAVNANPTAEMLSDIAITSCETVHKLLGWDPKAAFLSFSTDGSAEDELVDKVREGVRIAKERRPDLKMDGEFQMDAAIKSAVAAKKVHRPSDVAGQANVLIFPDLQSGNIAVKCVQFLAKGNAIGPVLQGIAKPIADCSRNASVEELLLNMAILVIRAQ